MKKNSARLIVMLFCFVIFAGLYQNCSNSGFSIVNPISRAVANSAGGGAGAGGNSGAGALPLQSSQSNVLPIVMNNTGFNLPTVSVTICVPGTQTCQTIDNILLDTGSTGLRIQESLITIPLSSANSAGSPLAECYQFGSGFAYWGPIEIADVFLGGELAPGISIQGINANYATTPPTSCTQDASGNKFGVYNATDLGFNGLLGVLPSLWDCGVAAGQSCGPSDGPPFYYTCPGNSSCVAATLSTSQQVPNPVAMLKQDNNGYAIQTPAIPETGASSLTGAFMVFGIGTQSNNIPPAGVNVIPVSQTSGQIFITMYGGKNASFIDSGSGMYAFSTSTIPSCNVGTGVNAFMMFCPSSTTTFSTIMEGINGTPQVNMNVQIFNGLTAYNDPNNYLYSNIAEPEGGALSALGSTAIFDWGFSFFYGRTIYFGMNGRSSGLGTGPFNAF